MGESSIFRVPGSLKCHQNQEKNCLDCGVGPGAHLLTKMSRMGWKNASKRDPILKQKLALGGAGTSYFHPWADKVAQKALEGAQGDPKGTILGGNWPPNHQKCAETGAKISKRGGNLKESAIKNWG